MFLIFYIFWVFNTNQQLVSNSIPLPYAYDQLKGEKALLKWTKFQNVCTFSAGGREKNLSPKILAKPFGKSNIWVVYIPLKCFASSTMCKKKHRVQTGYFKHGTFCDHSLWKMWIFILHRNHIKSITWTLYLFILLVLTLTHRTSFRMFSVEHIYIVPCTQA